MNMCIFESTLLQLGSFRGAPVPRFAGVCRDLLFGAFSTLADCGDAAGWMPYPFGFQVIVFGAEADAENLEEGVLL